MSLGDWAALGFKSRLAKTSEDKMGNQNLWPGDGRAWPPSWEPVGFGEPSSTFLNYWVRFIIFIWREAQMWAAQDEYSYAAMLLVSF